MSTVLDLIREFGALSDTKVRRGGTLAPSDDKRWEELNAFFEVLMSRSGLPVEGEKPPFTADEIRDHLTERNRLRVPVNRCAILYHQDSCHQARVVNLSRGGVFLASDTLLDVGSRPTLYLAGIGGDETEVMELTGEVTWRTERGVPEADLPRGMGFRFLDLSNDVREKLDSVVLGTIEKQLSSLW